MNLKTFVKVGSITNLSDARFCAGFGVDLLGFDFNPSSDNYISIEQANEIMGWVAGPAFVAEFGDMGLEEIVKLQEENKFPLLQVNTLETASALQVKGYDVILHIDVTSRQDLEELSLAQVHGAKLKHIIVDCTAPQLVPDIEKILTTGGLTSLIKAYDVELSQLDHIIQVQPFSGIELKGSQEEKPGFKEYDELADILEALEAED
ncbi:hypothetical protein N7E81_14655 [Reichenbachiella carrageenanivorans]|uniref:Phosphoribosylanthranilate isomerase n=1 Tax=Reichenbachiella carrageenanivorans TaxID=2979869 RepID=A0ABY6CXF1_9BACT|nr:hypothetical protein [Reichenbachiella carrageenanivorans]UXX78599.1 hypothetical protein N7E81_14655 [Reichenbachiella carrageenanivorans]